MIAPFSSQLIVARAPGRQGRQLLLDAGRDGVGEIHVVGEQDRLAGFVMLGLAEQIGGDPFGIVAAIGDHHDLGRAPHHVDADHAIDLPLGLGDPGVAGAGDDVDGPDPLGAISQSGNGLRAADAPDLRDARDMRGRQHGGIERAAPAWATS